MPEFLGDFWVLSVNIWGCPCVYLGTSGVICIIRGHLHIWHHLHNLGSFRGGSGGCRGLLGAFGVFGVILVVLGSLWGDFAVFGGFRACLG